MSRRLWRFWVLFLAAGSLASWLALESVSIASGSGNGTESGFLGRR
jgi:hypothetical protein